MSLEKVNHILLTGPPGIGKTTAIQTICNILKEKNVPLVGFYTKEVRNSSTRIGFDIATLDGRTGTLARLKDHDKSANRGYSFGRYTVCLNEFESVVLPIFGEKKADVVYIIDEIGKMELLSKAFEKAVDNLFATPNIKIIATIPITKFKPLPLVDKVKSAPSTILISLNRTNRNDIPDDIVRTINI